MGQDEVVAFLNHLANQRMMSAGTQSIALNALAFLYNKILEQPIQGLNFQRANKPRRLPIVLSVQEVSVIISELKDIIRCPLIIKRAFLVVFAIYKLGTLHLNHHTQPQSDGHYHL